MSGLTSTATVHPSTVVNERNHGAIVTIAAALCLTCSLIFFIARYIVRWPWRQLVGKDDVAAGASQVSFEGTRIKDEVADTI
jgi:hypothetical protein